MNNEYVRILNDRYVIDKKGRVFICKTGREVHPRINKRTRRKELRLYDKSKNPNCEKTSTFAHARLLYFSFHPELDYDDKSLQVRIKDNKINYELDDLYIIKREDIQWDFSTTKK